jgi:hypothetical protein
MMGNCRDTSLDSITTLVNLSPNQTGKDEFDLNAELASLKKVDNQPHIPIPIDIWKRVQDDTTIQVNMDVDKYTTHMEDSGRKRDGSYQLTPITSFFVNPTFWLFCFIISEWFCPNP